MKILKEYSLITLGVTIVAIALEYFFFPNDVAAGGVSGLALVLTNIINIEPSIITFVLNILLFAVAFMVIGSGFGAKSLYATAMLSIAMLIIEKVFVPRAITDNLILASIFGSAVLAMGSTIVFNQDASTGGTSIIAKILEKYFHIGIGAGLIIADCAVGVMAIYVFGIEKGLFGLLSATLVGLLVDKYIAGFNSCKQVFIVTTKEKLVVDYIMKDIDRGCTILNGKGAYTGVDNSMIYTVLSRKQFILLRQFLKKENPEAFVTVSESMEVLGKGFSDY